MGAPAYTYTLTNGTAADASQVMQDLNDVLNGITDGTKDISISALTVGGIATLNGNTTIGNSSGDDLTITASLASSVPVKTTFSYDLGANATGLKYIFLGSSDSAARSTKLAGATIASAYTFTFPVDGGTNRYVLQTNGSGTTSWAQNWNSSTAVKNLSLSCSVGTSALTIALKGADGNDPSSTNPVDIVFRNTTATSGAPLTASVTSAQSLVISSGSTLGHKSATNHYIYVYALYQSSSSFELLACSSLLDEGTLQTTTAEGGGGAADSIYVPYSTTARSNVPVRLIGRLKSSQVTAGTWAAVPTEVSLTPFSKQKAYLSVTSSTTALTSNTEADVVYTSVELDTHNSYNASTGVYTVPMTGVAKISAAIKLNVTASDWASGKVLRVVVNHSGAGDIRHGEWTAETASSTDPQAQVTTLYPVTAGDTLKIRAVQDAGSYSLTSTSSANVNYFSVEVDPYAF